MLLVNVYGPRDEPEFYNRLNEKSMELDIYNIIMTGDWNIVLDPSRDYINCKHVNNPKVKEAVESMIIDLDMCDIWRDMNPDCQRHTLRRTTPFHQATLDFFLATHSVVSLVEDSYSNCPYRTDHSIIILKSKLSDKSKRKRPDT